MSPRRRSRQKTRQPGAGDYINLSMLCKVIGVLILLPGILICMISLPAGLIGVAAGMLMLTLGIGLGRFRRWAWYLGIVVLVPLYMLGGLLGVVMVGVGVINVTSGALILSAVYVAWVLLSKGGRRRYEQIRAALDQANNESGTMLSKYYGRKKPRHARG